MGAQTSNRHLCNVCKRLTYCTAEYEAPDLLVQGGDVGILDERVRTLLQVVYPEKFTHYDSKDGN